MTRSKHSLCVLLCAWLLTAGVADAQPGASGPVDERTPTSDKERARQAKKLLKRAVALRKNKRWRASYDAFRGSHELAANPVALIGQGICQQELGDLIAAERAYTQAIALARDKGMGKIAAIAQKQLDKLDERPSSMRFDVDPWLAVNELEIVLQGEPVDRARWNDNIALAPGTYVVAVRAAGRHSWQQQVDIRAPNGARVLLTVPLLDRQLDVELVSDFIGPPAGGTPRVTIKPPPCAPPECRTGGDGNARRVQRRKTLGTVALGLGGVSLLASLAVGYTARTRWNDALSYCNGFRECEPEGIDLGVQAGTRADLATNIAMGSAVLLAAGGLLHWLGRNRTERRAASRLTVTPHNNAFTISLSGRY